MKSGLRMKKLNFDSRLDELKAVIVQVHGGKYRWSWKKFRVAMQSMGC